MVKTRTRLDKIKFLKGVMTGQNQISELLPKEIIVFRNDNESNLFHCEKMNLEFTEKEYKTFQKEHPEITFILIRREIIKGGGNYTL